ncbi:uncharacterized protein FIBRA_03772 [Fibroporia radiculosa]|uniref:Dynamin N-terminal domain-containing protein n=1 Tax=Fibroporia radiculosa TaxID=599839 RepID=J4HW62_9APHY|nr:uncharacterized protein FIBRA_03772 [Fibroporia radiculosa]CCM01707.1 predicted protein [Fibroporia radiculosa]
MDPSSSSLLYVKPEPQEQRILPLSTSTTYQNAYPVAERSGIVDSRPAGPSAAGAIVSQNVAGASNGTTIDSALVDLSSVLVKGEDDHTQIPNQLALQVAPESLRSLYNLYGSVDEIDYLPENVFKEGLGMVKTIDANIKKLELGSKLREDVWVREVESLQSQGAPTTMIAVCGATGSGKSSTLNAILDDNIVPTSGMRVVTEIGYHTKKTIDADVSFLSENEWRDELAVLLDDMIDETGNVKRTTDLRGDAGVAWQKVHAVYPLITQDQLVQMSIDQIIDRDLNIKAILGTTKHIVANNSKLFAKKIAKYIDSKDQKRGEKKDKESKEKEKEKEKDKVKSLMSLLRKDNGKKDDRDDAAFWPLIRQVNVRCNSPALSTGAILVDLPGVADANAARNNIAKDYMKKCDCIWILAPITRAVDDKTARDLLGDAFKMQLMSTSTFLSDLNSGTEPNFYGIYDDHAITFIATKCDDVSCSEIIRALNLEDETELVVIEAQIDECKDGTEQWKDKKAEAEKAAKTMNRHLKEMREYLEEYEAHLKALENGKSFEPRMTANTANNKKSNSQTASGKKRKTTRDGKQGPSKKRRGSDEDDSSMAVDDDDDFMDDDELEFSDSNSDNDSSDSSDNNDSHSKSEANFDSDDNYGEDDETEEAEEVTIDSLKAKIEEAKDAIKVGRVQLSEYRKERKEAADMLATLKKRQLKIQLEKNAFCSLKRSEFSRDVLKEDFRQGLKDLDDAAAEQRDPGNFDTTVDIRNYAAIDLPVFTCSSRDYVRLKGQVKGDGDPTCFSKVDDTGIPELQKWCHQLTASSRECAARNFLVHLKTFTNSVRTYVQGIGDVTVGDRETLREKWESTPLNDDDGLVSMLYNGVWGGSDGLDEVAYDILGRAGLSSMNANKLPPKVDRFGERIGITPRLVKDFKKVIDDCVLQLQNIFREGLEEKCRVGAANAASAAVQTSDSFAAGMHWATYRATLRRHGSWRQDLNVELTNPFTRNIASSWSKVFEADLFLAFDKAATDAINKLLADVEESTAIGLKERAKGQGELCQEEARLALRKTLDIVSETIQTEQKEISRCLAPHVQNQLVEGYDLAMEERGPGSVVRQKGVFHDFVDNIKNEVFNDGAEVIMGRLSNAAEAIGRALEDALEKLAEKARICVGIEVSIAVLWEGPRDDPSQVKARDAIVATMTEILEQVQFWQQAERRRQLEAHD